MDQLTYTSRRTSAPAARPIERIAGGRFVLRLLFWSGLAVAVLPWWLGTKSGSLDSTGATLSAAGRLTGLIAGYVLLVQVVMMSRLSVLERWIGARHLTLWHKELGGFLLIAILSHAALITVGYAYLAHAPVLKTFGHILSTYPDMAPAIIAAGMLVCIGLLSVRTLRKAVPYEAWYFLHLSTYLVLFLAYAHQFSNGTELYQGLRAADLDRLLRPGMIVPVAWGRLVARSLNLRHRLRVADVVAEGAGHDLGVHHRATGCIDLRRAGRAVLPVAVPRSGAVVAGASVLAVSRAQRSLAAADHQGGRQPHRTRCAICGPGVRIFVEGPWGDFTASRRVRSRTLLIAAGSGIAPIRALLEELPPGAVVIYRASSAVHDLHLRDELEHLADLRHATLWFVVGDRRDPGPRRLFTPTRHARAGPRHQPSVTSTCAARTGWSRSR